MRKITIMVPESLFADIDRSARERGESRNRYVSHVLQNALVARRDAEITRKLDFLLADPKARHEQRTGAHGMALDTLFSDEFW